MRFLPRLLAASAALLVSVVLLPARADAYDEPYVAGVRPNNTKVAIASNSCRNIGYSLRIGGGSGLNDLYANGNVEAWRGVSNVGSDYAYGDVGSGGSIRGAYYWCPSLDGLGTFRLRYVGGEWSGVTECEVYDYEWDYCESGEDYVDGALAGGASGTFTVKQAAKVVNLRAQRSGARRSISAKAMFYSIGRSQWAAVPRGSTVVLQRRSVGGSVWANVKTVTVGRSGVVSTSWTADRVRDYRLVTRSTTNTWSGISAVVRR